MKLKTDFEITEILACRYAVPKGENAKEHSCVVRLVNDTTVRIFSLIQEGFDTDSIVGMMMNEYDVEEERLRAEIEKVISVLEQNDLIER